MEGARASADGGREPAHPRVQPGPARPGGGEDGQDEGAGASHGCRAKEGDVFEKERGREGAEGIDYKPEAVISDGYGPDPRYKMIWGCLGEYPTKSV